MENTYINKMIDGLHKDRDKANEKLDAAELEYNTKREAITKELAEIAEAETRLMREGKGIGAIFPEDEKPSSLNRLRRTEK
jgi:hypothetical protein